MAFSSCFCHSPISLKIDHLRKSFLPKHNDGVDQRFAFTLKSNSTELFGKQVVTVGADIDQNWSFMGGSRVVVRPKLEKFVLHQRGSRISASWLTSSQIAGNAFGFGTAAVLPFYALMVLAPKSELTKKSMDSSIPYVVLGVLYAYLLYLSWKPETLRLLFTSKYYLPELAGITKMFSSEFTLASAWIHLVVADLFAARQVFREGRENQVETRHSITLCLFFCPIGIVTHFITKAITRSARNSRHHMH